MMKVLGWASATFSILSLTSATLAFAQGVPSAARRGLMNPDISANVLMLYTNSSRGNMTTSPEQNGPSVQEAEVQLLSDVDPYTRLNVVLSVHQEPIPAATDGATPRSGEWKLEPEEAYVESIALPLVTLRAGKFKSAFGKHNQMHTHAFPFVEQPLVNTTFLGDEGLNDAGVSAAVLIPVNWFSEITGQVLAGKTQSDSTFNSRSTNSNVYLAHLKNVWDLSDDLTLEFGLSDAYGKNEPRDQTVAPTNGSTHLYGGDLTFKWRPANGGKYHALIWSTEYMNLQADRSNASQHGQGYASWLQYQFAQRWWAQVRSEYVEANETDATASDFGAGYQRKYSALVGFFPSEFSGARIQYSHLVDQVVGAEDKIYVQLNFTIGAHPAHMY